MRSGMCGHVEMHNVTTVMTEDDENIENTKRGFRLCTVYLETVA